MPPHTDCTLRASAGINWIAATLSLLSHLDVCGAGAPLVHVGGHKRRVRALAGAAAGGGDPEEVAKPGGMHGGPRQRRLAWRHLHAQQNAAHMHWRHCVVWIMAAAVRTCHAPASCCAPFCQSWSARLCWADCRQTACRLFPSGDGTLVRRHWQMQTGRLPPTGRPPWCRSGPCGLRRSCMQRQGSAVPRVHQPNSACQLVLCISCKAGRAAQASRDG